MEIFISTIKVDGESLKKWQLNRHGDKNYSSPTIQERLVRLNKLMFKTSGAASDGDVLIDTEVLIDMDGKVLSANDAEVFTESVVKDVGRKPVEQKIHKNFQIAKNQNFQNLTKFSKMPKIKIFKI